MDSTQPRPAALRLAQDRPDLLPGVATRLAERDARDAAGVLNAITIDSQADRPRQLRYEAEHAPTPALRAAARLLLDEDAAMYADDGIGGYQWIDGRLRWVADQTGRAIYNERGVRCELLPGSVEVPVGSSIYSLHLCNGWIRQGDGQGAYGYCDGNINRILIANTTAPPHRLEVAWHEIMHAFFFEFTEACASDRLTAEQFCDVAGKGMAGLGPLKFAEIAAFVTCSAFAAPPQSATAQA
ncbi:MAG: hypothetical protein AAGA29_03630 [Planctomycetota bacterium]